MIIVQGLGQLGVPLGPVLEPDPLPDPPPELGGPDDGSADETTGATASKLRKIPSASHNHFVLKVTLTVSGLRLLETCVR